MKIKCIIFLLLFFPLANAKPHLDLKATTNPTLLPNPYPVYTKNNVVVNHPYPGFLQKLLPVNNDYKKNPGCYIACYSHESKNSIYAVSDNIFVHGFIRVPGNYTNRICVPNNYEGQDISAAPFFKALCNAKIKTCHDCWAGGDTGGFLGR